MSRNNLLLAAASAMVALVTAYFVATAIDRRGGSDIVVQSAASDATIAVWIEGAVNNPGIYRLPTDARLNDALVAAGGLAGNADLAQLNLAERLTDMQHIVIPATASGDAIVSVSAAATDSSAPTNSNKQAVNINTASESELESLPKIGPALAARIIEYRETNGPFARVEELARVDGISPAMVDGLAGLISVGP